MEMESVNIEIISKVSGHSVLFVEEAIKRCKTFEAKFLKDGMWDYDAIAGYLDATHLKITVEALNQKIGLFDQTNRKQLARELVDDVKTMAQTLEKYTNL